MTEATPLTPTTHTECSPAGVTVYFDGSCPLCRREVAVYQRLQGHVPLQWHDVSQQAPDAVGLCQQQAMARFHVLDANGQLHSGAKAFVVLWRQLPGWRWLAKVAALPGVTPLLEWGYVHFLKVRPRLQQWVRGRQSGCP